MKTVEELEAEVENLIEKNDGLEDKISELEKEIDQMVEHNREIERAAKELYNMV